MEFFEGKRVRELRTTFEDALDQTLEPQTMEVRRRPPPRPRGELKMRGGGKRGKNSPTPGRPPVHPVP